MNNKTILSNIIISITVTIVYILFFNISNNISIALTFISSLILCTLWTYFVSVFKPIRITKDMDETLHPVIQTEKILHISNIQKYYEKEYNLKLVERCDCGSNLFRIYNEDTEKGTYIQFICAKCNQKATNRIYAPNVKRR